MFKFNQKIIKIILKQFKISIKKITINKFKNK